MFLTPIRRKRIRVLAAAAAAKQRVAERQAVGYWKFRSGNIPHLRKPSGAGRYWRIGRRMRWPTEYFGVRPVPVARILVAGGGLS
jgi:hypothetical protein